MTREIALRSLCSRTALNMDGRTEWQTGEEKFPTTGCFFPRRGSRSRTTTRRWHKRMKEGRTRVVEQVDDAAGRVPAAWHTVEISDSVLATIRQRAQRHRQLPGPLPLLMSSEKAKPIRAATTAMTSDRDEWWRSLAHDWHAPTSAWHSGWSQTLVKMLKFRMVHCSLFREYWDESNSEEMHFNIELCTRRSTNFARVSSFSFQGHRSRSNALGQMSPRYNHL